MSVLTKIIPVNTLPPYTRTDAPDTSYLPQVTHLLTKDPYFPHLLSWIPSSVVENVEREVTGNTVAVLSLYFFPPVSYNWREVLEKRRWNKNFSSWVIKMFWKGMERGQKLPQGNSVPILWLFVVAVRALTDWRTVLSFTLPQNSGFSSDFTEKNF